MCTGVLKCPDAFATLQEIPAKLQAVLQPLQAVSATLQDIFATHQDDLPAHQVVFMYTQPAQAPS